MADYIDKHWDNVLYRLQNSIAQLAIKSERGNLISRENNTSQQIWSVSHTSASDQVTIGSVSCSGNRKHISSLEPGTRCGGAVKILPKETAFERAIGRGFVGNGVKREEERVVRRQARYQANQAICCRTNRSHLTHTDIQSQKGRKS